ncbi:MAG: C45 family autoproteolytic acyltransferase/hydrolase [Planctomycetota bacterium]|nr:C45 family autoproteolytic acyltransferase/hydrolase [Planctomycetota bacterium]
MNLRAVLWLPLLVLLALPAWAEDTATTVKVNGRLETIEGQAVLTVWGTPRERGFAHGYLLAEAIVRGIERDFEQVLGPFIPRYEALVRKMVVPQFAFDARELEELEGLAAGLKERLPEEQQVISALKRPFDLLDIKALNTFGDWYGLGCSSLAVWGRLTTDGKTLVGRNFDFPGFGLLLRHPTVIVRAADGEHAGSVGVSYPGCIGTLTGMNTDGVFVAVHDVRVKPTLDKAVRPNVPRLLAVRRLLEQTRGPKACLQALDLARSWPTLYGNNLMVVAPGAVDGVPRAAVLEYDCRTDLDGGCTVRLSNSEGAEAKPGLCLACTNHHRCRVEPEGYEDLYERWRFPELIGAESLEKPLDVAGMFAQVGRVAFPREGVQKLAKSVQGAGRAHGTLHQTVGEPDRGRLHVRFGTIGTHIRDATPRAYDVPALVRAAK